MGKCYDKMSLAEYAAENPQAVQVLEIQEQAERARNYTERKEAEAKAAELMAQILRQLESGSAPQAILYTAIEAIGTITGAEAWKITAEQSLNAVYADLAQQSLLVDTERTEAERLQARAEEQAAKIRRQLEADLRKCRQLETALQEALNSATRIYPSDI